MIVLKTADMEKRGVKNQKTLFMDGPLILVYAPHA